MCSPIGSSRSYADASLASDTATLVVITGTLVLSWSLLLSQAMESVTRAFYARSDLDLILSSPASARKVFAVRMGRIAAAAVAIAVLLAAPFINVLALLGGARWLAAYGVVAAMGAVATAAALALTIALFRTRRGQAHAADRADRGGGDRRRLRHRPAGRGDLFLRQSFRASRRCNRTGCWRTRPIPPAHSGGRRAPCSATTCALAARCRVRLRRARRGDRAVLAALRRARHGGGRRLQHRRAPAPLVARASAAAPPAACCGTRNGRCSQRDPWLVSQTLMQLLYLLPPALLLWVTFGDRQRCVRRIDSGAGDGGRSARRRLAWLSISGEDAPDLVATAPIAAASRPAAPRSKRSSASSR